MNFSTIKRDSGLLASYGRERRAIEAVIDALEELKKNAVLGHIKCDYVRGARKKILDVVFTLFPSMEFIRDTKAGNKRLHEAQALVAQR